MSMIVATLGFFIFLVIAARIIFHIFVFLDKKDKKISELVRAIEAGLGIFFDYKGMNCYAALNEVHKYITTIERGHVSVRVECDSKIESPFLVRLESVYSKVKDTLGKGDIKIGEKEIDEMMFITAENPSIVTALLNKEIREKLLFIGQIAAAFDLTENSIMLKVRNQQLDDLPVFVKYLQTIVSIIEEVSSGDPIKKRLIKNIKKEEEWKVRLNNLIMLASHFPSDSEIKKILDGSLRDESLEIRFEAAKHLKARGLKFLISMLNSIENKSHPLIPEIILFLAENNYKQCIPRLKILFDQSESEAVQIEILTAFKDFRDEKLNAFLLKRLNAMNTMDTKILLMVIKALGTCGTLNAVEPVYELGKNSPDSRVREEAERSIALIQSRKGQGEKGWLSIPEFSETDGALSINNEARGGALSVNNEEDPEKG